MGDPRVPFGLRDCATDSEASWDRESDLDSVFPSDSDADSFIGELGSDVCDGEFFSGANAGSVEKDGARANNDSHSGFENALLNNVVDGKGLHPSAKGDPRSGERIYRKESSEQSWRHREHIAAYQGPDEGSVFDQFASFKKESWSEIDERARLDNEVYRGDARPDGIKAGHERRSERPRKRGGGRGRRKKQQAQKRNESTSGQPRDGYEGTSKSQNWGRRSGKGRRPRTNKNKDDKKIPARRGRCDPPLINAVVRPFTLPAGPITILRRPPAAAPVSEDTPGSANGNESGPHPTVSTSPKLSGMPTSQEHSSVHGSPPPSLPNASQESGDLIGVGPAGGAGGSHVIHVTTRYGPGIVVENPRAQQAKQAFGVEGTDSENEERLQAARDAAELAMAGLSMGTELGEEEIPKPKKEQGRKISAETYDRGYIGAVESGAPPAEQKPKYPKKRSRGGRARNRSKNAEKNGSINQKFQPKFLLTRPNQASVEGRNEFHYVADNIYGEVGE